MTIDPMHHVKPKLLMRTDRGRYLWDRPLGLVKFIPKGAQNCTDYRLTPTTANNLSGAMKVACRMEIEYQNENGHLVNFREGKA